MNKRTIRGFDCEKKGCCKKWVIILTLQTFLARTYLMTRSCRNVFQRKFTRNSMRSWMREKNLILRPQTSSHMRWRSGLSRKVLPIIPTGFSHWPVWLQRNMIPLLLLQCQMARFWWAFPVKNWSRASRMHLPSRQADFVRHLRQEDIQHGIVHHLLSFVRTQQEPLFVFQLLSVLTQEKHWIRRHHFFVPWKQSIHSLSVC